ncbi:MAG: hypothetical protein WAL30_01475 [Candidatus Aquirickettsiella sp.]
MLAKANFHYGELKEDKEAKKAMLSNAQCFLMGISINKNEKEGKTTQSGEGLGAFIEAINKVPGKPSSRKVIFVITDYLHRHYKQLDTRCENFEESARAEGERWIEVNRPFLEKLSIQYEIVRWEDLIRNAWYEESLLRVKNDYKKDDAFKKIIDNYATEFGKKKYNELKSKVEGITLELCELAAINYGLEECTSVFTFLPYAPDVMTYPAKDCNKAVSYIYQKYIEKASENFSEEICKKYIGKSMNYIGYRVRWSGQEKKKVSKQEINAAQKPSLPNSFFSPTEPGLPVDMPYVKVECLSA